MFKKKKSSFFFVSKLFFCNFKISLPQTVLFMCVSVWMFARPKDVLCFSTRITPHIPIQTLDATLDFLKEFRLTTLSGVYVCYMRHAKFCVIRNLMLAKRKDEERSIFFYCVHVCACMCAVLYVFPFFYKIDRVNLSSTLLFPKFCF